MTRDKPENKEPTEKIPENTEKNQPVHDDVTIEEDVTGDAANRIPPPPPLPPLAVPGQSGVLPKKNITGHKRTNTSEQVHRDTADEVTDIEDKTKKSAKKKPQVPRQPTLQAQMTALMERMDRHVQRTDQIYSIVRPSAPSTPDRPDWPSRSRDSPPRTRETHRHRRPVHGSHYKRTSPRSGHSRRYRAPRKPSAHEYSSSSRSSDSSPADSDTQVRRAMEMLEPRFHRYKGKSRSRDDKVIRYRPFAYLDREAQRAILKSGHPEELTLTQHLMGLCAMAQDQCDELGNAHAILSHINQILDDQTYMHWSKVRAFSNTVVSSIARGNWKWVDDKLIERCRNNIYMRTRHSEESGWSVPCPRYNRGRCESQDTHSVGEVEMRHVCMYCASSGFENTHTLRACNWKKGKTSNTQQRGNHDEKREGKPQRYHGASRNDHPADASKN